MCGVLGRPGFGGSAERREDSEAVGVFVKEGGNSDRSGRRSREFSDAAARQDAMWHIATGAAAGRQGTR